MVIGYRALIAAVAAERGLELVVSRRNVARLRAGGAREVGRGHYRVMVAAHAGLLIACPAEVALSRRRFVPAVGWPALGVVLAAQVLRWWCVASLGRRWSTRIVVLPGAPLVRHGPYRYLRHPNYVAVVAEGAALPMVHGAWLTALAFSAINAAILRTRIRAEDAALDAGVQARVQADRRAEHRAGRRAGHGADPCWTC